MVDSVSRWISIVAVMVVIVLLAPAMVKSTMIEPPPRDFVTSGDIFIGGNITVENLEVAKELRIISGDTLYLNWLEMENMGHYTSANTNWIVEHDDSPSAFVGVYANNGSIMSNAHLILESGGSSTVFTKNSPLHPLSANSSGWINEDGNIGLFVEHDEEIIWFHFDNHIKDAYGNIVSLQGAERLMTLDDAGLNLSVGNLMIDYGGISLTNTIYFDTSGNLNVLQVNDTDDAYLSYFASANMWGINKGLSISSGAYGSGVNYITMQDGLGIVTIGSVNGTPENVLTASKGSLAMDTYTGDVYVKKTDSTNTEWISLVDKEYADLFDRALKTGIISGGALSINTSTTINVAAGIGVIINATNASNIIRTDVSWGEIIGFAPTTIGIEGSSIIMIDSNGNVSDFRNVDKTGETYRDYIILGTISIYAGGIIMADSRPFNLGYVSQSFEDFVRDVIGTSTISGLIYSPWESDLSLEYTSGRIFDIGCGFAIGSQNSPNECDVSGVSQPVLFMTYHDDQLLIPDGTPTIYINPNKIDNGDGTTSSVGSNKWTIQRIFYSPTATLVNYGQEEYTTYTKAFAAMKTQQFFEAGALPTAWFRAYLIINEGATDLSDTNQAVFHEATKFRITGTTGGAGAEGVSTHSSLSDLEWNVSGHTFNDADQTMNIGSYDLVTSGLYYGDGSQLSNIQFPSDNPTPYGISSEGLIGYWTGNGNTLDYSGEGYDGTLTGDATYSDGIFGQGFELDGSGDSVNMGDINDYQFSGNDIFSVSAWIKIPGGVSSTDTFVSKGGGSPNGWVLRIDSNEKVQFRTNNQAVVTPSALSTNTWHHIVVTHNETTIFLYVDGSLVKTGTPTLKVNSGADFIIGTASSQWFTGSVDEVMIFDRELSATEIETLYTTVKNSGLWEYDSGNTILTSGYARIADGGLRIARNGDPYLLFARYDTQVGQIRANTNTTISITNFDGSAEYLTVNTNSGYVGIGTITPTQILDVVGSITFSDALVFVDGSTQTSAQDGFLGHVSTAVFKQSFSVAAQDTSPRDMHFKPDGTKLYVSGVAGDGIIWEYDLSDPWNISSMVYNSNYFNVETWENNPMGLFIRNDGRKMYISGSGEDEVNEFNLEIAWNVSTASWVSLFDVSSDDTSPVGVEFRPDGKKMYIVGDQHNDVTEYDLTTAWDITTAVWNQEFGTNIDAPTGFAFSQDGTRMYVMDGSAEDDIHEYVLSTPWDISTAKLERLFDVSSQNPVPQDIAFSPDKTKVYMLGSTSPASVFEYDLGLSVSGNITMYSPDGTGWNCGVSNTGVFSCS